MTGNPFADALERILNLGVKKGDDIQKIRQIRQINGLCVIWTLVALSTSMLLYFLVPGMNAVIGITSVAMALYFSGLILNYLGKMKLAARMTIIVFEWHLFMVIALTNMWNSSALFVIVVYPLLAALMELSIWRHLFISLLQATLLLGIHLLMPDFEARVFRFSGIEPQASLVVLIISVFYIPVMAAAVINIIYRENQRAREKQRQLINEVSIANRKLEYYAEQLKDETRRLKAELDVARKLQMMVLPAPDEFSEIRDLDISCIMRTADEVGGDYYDIFKLGNVTTIAIGDVTGHGLSSGIIMLMAQTAIRTLAETFPENPSEILVILNRVLYSNINRIREERNMTLAIIFHHANRFIVSGQHETLIICRKNGKIEQIETLDLGYYVGMLPDIAHSVKTREFRLNPGDILFLYSDGVTEAENERHEQYGMSRMLENLSRCHELSSEEIRTKMMRDLYNFMGQREILDDISMVVIKQK